MRWLLVVLISLFAACAGTEPSEGVDKTGNADGQVCSGEAFPCASYVDVSCEGQGGCSWIGDLTSGQCAGLATTCDELGPDDCDYQDGCELEG